MKFSCPTIMLIAISLAPIVSAAPSSPPGGAKDSQKSLDEQLLEDLGGIPPAAKPSEPRRQASKPLENLEGEDVSLGADGPSENPLVRLGQRMKQVERRIGEAHGDEKTQRLQDEISADLNSLIAELERQAAKQRSQSSASSRPQPASRPKPENKASRQPSEGPASDRPASDSDAGDKERGTAKVGRAGLQEMLKDVWGHLPPHLRQQMEQSANEEFLPKYELEIADYYRSLLSGRREKK